MRRLYSFDGATDVQPALTAAKGASWTPADEDPSDPWILDAREWQTVRLFPTFRDGGGAQAAGTSVALTPLVRIPDPASPTGFRWLASGTSVTINDGATAEVSVDGHVCAFRVTAVTLGAATDVVLRATGGTLVPRQNG